MVKHPTIPPGAEADELVLAYWNPLYLCYGASNGYADPTDQLVYDALHFPDKMTPFIAWLAGQYTEFSVAHGAVPDKPLETEQEAIVQFRLHREAFTVWAQHRWLPKQPHLGVRINQEEKHESERDPATADRPAGHHQDEREEGSQG